jgi:hypothetical protein
MNNFTQLCVWPGTELGESTPKEFSEWFQEAMGVRVQYHTEIKTLPDLDSAGRPIPETGGRNDLFFFIHTEDVKAFAVPRLKMGIRWWEDVIVYNDNSHLYTKEFISNHQPTW